MDDARSHLGPGPDRRATPSSSRELIAPRVRPPSPARSARSSSCATSTARPVEEIARSLGIPVRDREVATALPRARRSSRRWRPRHERARASPTPNWSVACAPITPRRGAARGLLARHPRGPRRDLLRPQDRPLVAFRSILRPPILPCASGRCCWWPRWSLVGMLAAVGRRRRAGQPGSGPAGGGHAPDSGPVLDLSSTRRPAGLRLRARYNGAMARPAADDDHRDPSTIF